MQSFIGEYAPKTHKLIEVKTGSTYSFQNGKNIQNTPWVVFFPLHLVNSFTDYVAASHRDSPLSRDTLNIKAFEPYRPGGHAKSTADG